MYTVEFRNNAQFPATIDLFHIKEKPDTLTPAQVKELVEHVYDIAFHLHMNNVEDAQTMEDEVAEYSIVHGEHRSELTIHADVTYVQYGHEYGDTIELVCYIRMARIVDLSSTS